jgi:hypothetical protein
MDSPPHSLPIHRTSPLRSPDLTPQKLFYRDMSIVSVYECIWQIANIDEVREGMTESMVRVGPAEIN